MFLTNDNKDLKDFLAAVQFIAPKGMSVSYFITPQQMQLPNNSGFQPQLPKAEDESQTYVMTPPVEKIDQAVTPGEFSQWNPEELKRKIPTPNVLPPITEPKDLQSPFIKVLSESKTIGTDIQLLEDYYMFPKGTVFHCIVNKLNENKGHVDPDDEAFWIRPNGERVRRPLADGYTARMEALGKPTVEDMGGLDFNDSKPGELDFLWKHNELNEASLTKKDIHDKIWGKGHINQKKYDHDIIELYKEGMTPEEIKDYLMEDKYYASRLQSGVYKAAEVTPEGVDPVLYYIEETCKDFAWKQRGLQEASLGKLPKYEPGTYKNYVNKFAYDEDHWIKDNIDTLPKDPHQRHLHYLKHRSDNKRSIMDEYMDLVKPSDKKITQNATSPKEIKELFEDKSMSLDDALSVLQNLYDWDKEKAINFLLPSEDNHLLIENNLKETLESDKYEEDKGFLWKFRPLWRKADDLEADVRWLYNAHYTPEEILEILSNDPDYKKRWTKLFDGFPQKPLYYIERICDDHIDRQRFRSESDDYLWDEKKKQYMPKSGEEDFRKEEKLMKKYLNEAELPKEPNWFDKMFEWGERIDNEPGMYQVSSRFDKFIDGSLNEGKSPKEIAKEILDHPYWNKQFKRGKSENPEKDIITYIFRREQKKINGEWGKGDGEEGQLLLPFELKEGRIIDFEKIYEAKDYIPLKKHTRSAQYPPTAQGWRDFYRHNVWSNEHNSSKLTRAMNRFQNTHGFSDMVRRYIWRIEQNHVMYREPDDECWHTKPIPREEQEKYMNMMPDDIEILVRKLDKYKYDDDFQLKESKFKDAVFGKEDWHGDRDWGRTKRRFKSAVASGKNPVDKFLKGAGRIGHEMFGGDVWDDMREEQTDYIEGNGPYAYDPKYTVASQRKHRVWELKDSWGKRSSDWKEPELVPITESLKRIHLSDEDLDLIEELEGSDMAMCLYCGRVCDWKELHDDECCDDCWDKMEEEYE